MRLENLEKVGESRVGLSDKYDFKTDEIHSRPLLVYIYD